MRRPTHHPLALLAVLGAGALGLTACGESDEAPAGAAAAAPSATASPAPSGTPVPSDAGPPLEIAAADRRRLDAGEIGVVDLENRARVEPPGMRANAEQVLRRVRWTGWGAATAKGRGTVEVLICEPTCGRGQAYDTAATVELSGVRTCGSRRFYGVARLRYRDRETRETAEPAVFLRTPC